MAPQAIELAPIEVTVRSQFLERSGFYERAQQGLGHALDRREIGRYSPAVVSDVIQRLTRVRVADTHALGQPVTAVAPGLGTSSNGDCVLQVYIDGVRTSDNDLNQVPPDWLDAMEVYTGSSAPIQYAGLNPCGAVLLWTRR